MMGTSLGRLKFRTAEEARGAARDLGLSGIHSHMMNGERVWMPGQNHQRLNEALRERGKEPTMTPGGAMSSGMGSGMNATTNGDSDGLLGEDMSDDPFAERTVELALDAMDGGNAMFDGDEIPLDEDVEISVTDGAAADDIAGELVGDRDGDGEMEIY